MLSQEERDKARRQMVDFLLTYHQDDAELIERIHNLEHDNDYMKLCDIMSGTIYDLEVLQIKAF